MCDVVLTLSLIIHQYDSIDHLSNCSIDRSAGTREHSDHFIRTFHGTVTPTLETNRYKWCPDRPG